MPSSNGSKIGAIGLAVAIFLASIAAFWLIDSATTKQSTYENSAQNRADDYAKRRNIIEKDRCLSLPSKEEAACKNEEREAARQGYRDEYDLEAQRVTANWTEHMGIAAIIGMAASLVGVGLVFFTFRETQRTAQIAQNNLISYQDSEAGRMIPQLEFIMGGEVSVKVKNAGKSDAHILHSDVCLLNYDKDIVIRIPIKVSKVFRTQNLVIHPEKVFSFENIAIPGNGFYTIAGGVIYIDIFRRVRLCSIGIDIVIPEYKTFSSTNIDFAKWEQAARDLQEGKEIDTSK